MQYTKCENQLDTIFTLLLLKTTKEHTSTFLNCFPLSYEGLFQCFPPSHLLVSWVETICALYMTDDVNSHFLSNCANLFMPVYLLWDQYQCLIDYSA